MLYTKNIISSGENEVNKKGLKILQDISKSGKKRNWDKRKKQNILLSLIYRYLISTDPGYENKANRVRDCGTYLQFAECTDNKCNHKKLINANFCRDRLCPLCRWRRSLKLAYQLKEICHIAHSREGVKFLSLTLTVKNCSAENLAKTIDKMNYAFRKLKGRKIIKDVLFGYFKAIEITYNSDEDSYHPHFHILLAVKKSYFQGRYYISQDKWTKLWKESLKVDYKPIVHIQRIKAKTDHIHPSKKDMISSKIAYAAAESAKYSIKPDDYLDIKNGTVEEVQESAGIVYILDKELKHKRLVTFGGLLKDIRQELNQDDIDDEEVDLVNVDEQNESEDCQCEVCNSNLTEIVYNWNPGLNLYTTKE